MMGKPDKKGRAELMRAAREYALEGFSAPIVSLLKIEDLIREEMKQAFKDTALDIADSIFGWTTQVEVSLDWRGRDGDITLELMSDVTVLSRVKLSDLLNRDISIMDDEDAEEGKRDGLSSKAWLKRKFVRGLRRLADNIEKGKFDE